MLREAGWKVVNLAQALFLASWTVFNFVFTFLALMLTWSRNIPLATARVMWGPVNLRAGFARLVVEGREGFDKTKPCIVMMNHQSMMDVAVAFTSVPVNIRFVAKKETLFIPFVGWYMWAMGMVFIEREKLGTAVQALRKAATIIRDGAVVFAFPEGTRTKDGTIGPFKKGIFMLAIEAGVPIVPMACEGCREVLPTVGWRPRPGTIRVKFGAPIPTAGLTAADRDALIQTVRDRMIDLHLEIGGRGGDRERAVAGRGVHTQSHVDPQLVRG